MRRNQFKIKIRNTYRKKKSLRVEADFVVHVSVCRNVCCGLTGWQWAEQLMLLVRSRWNPLAGSRLRLHCLLWHKPSSSCSTSVWPGRNTPRSPNTHTASRTEHTHTHTGQSVQGRSFCPWIIVFRSWQKYSLIKKCFSASCYSPYKMYACFYPFVIYLRVFSFNQFPWFGK